MHGKTANPIALSLALLFAVFLWGGNNTGTKLLVSSWPPVWTGGTRFFLAGLIMLALLRWTSVFGTRQGVYTQQLRRRLWTHGGLILAAYIVAFNTALRYTSASHVALYLGAAPVWALLWEHPPGLNWFSFRKYGAAGLALVGVVVLFLPSLRAADGSIAGELLGLAASVLWTSYGRQCRSLGQDLGGAEVSAHTMWRAGLLLLPVGCWEAAVRGIPLRWEQALVQGYCILAGGVAAFGIWSHALRRWPTSKVYLFNNLIPLSTMAWAHFWLGERIAPTFWLAMLLVIAGVLIGQNAWEMLWRRGSVAPQRKGSPSDN